MAHHCAPWPVYTNPSRGGAPFLAGFAFPDSIVLTKPEMLSAVKVETQENFERRWPRV
jgi:hypothetical protein